MANLTGSTTAVFFVRLSAAVDEIVGVNWNTRNGTAISGIDYEAASGTVSFLPGETEKTIDVIVYGQDDVSADGKKFYIELKPPANAVLTDALAECVITVADEDGVLVTSLVIAQGKRGLKGNPGFSAYEQAVIMGYQGTIQDWMNEIADASMAAGRSQQYASESAAHSAESASSATEAANIAATVTAMNAGQEYFLTQTALLASAPTAGKKVAKALDTKKVWMWQKPNANPGTWTDTGLSELDLAKAFADQLINAKSESIDIQINGGDLYYAKSSAYTIDGYINASGAFVSSAAGYKTTDFIQILPNRALKYYANASSSVAAISYWDENKAFIRAITSNNKPVEVTVTPPANAKYIRSSSNLKITPTAYVHTIIAALINDPSLIKTTSLTISPSANLANPSLIVEGSYVNNAGTIAVASGWKHIKIPVTPGVTYTFGRFVIDSAGYYSFYNSSNSLIAGSNGSYQNNSIPKTVTAPAGAAFLLFDIARPTNTSKQHAQLTVNVGTTLIDYVAPTETVTHIAGYKLAGGSSGGGETPLPENVVVQGGNATLGDLLADTIRTGALIANLPTSASGLEVGQAYIDTATGTIKVVI